MIALNPLKKGNSLMTKYKESALSQEFFTIVLGDTVVFPSVPTVLEIYSKHNAEVCREVNKNDDYVFIISNKIDGSLNETGTVCKIVAFDAYDDGGAKVTVQGFCRATLTKLDTAKDTASVVCKTVQIHDVSADVTQLKNKTAELVGKLQKTLPRLPKEAMDEILKEENPGMYCDLIASTMLPLYSDRQQILEEFDPVKRLELLATLLKKQVKMAAEEVHIHKLTRQQIEENQRDYYLREQLKVLKRELGEDEEYDEEIADYMERTMKAGLEKEIEEKLVKEIKKLAKLPFASPESNVIRNYLDACLELPWNMTSKDCEDLSHAKTILDRDHDGMEDVKTRILEFLAVKNMAGSNKNQIICLCGAPGIGKTSVVSSIAEALGRKYVRVALGGIRDEADIRGHRKTYIGAMPGRIIDAVTRAKVANPLILLDEIDKITRDAHGDPASALLEVLDPDQNKNFRDHFIELPFDLSECLFIATANTLDTIPRPLLDRMEVIEMKTYSKEEKLSIAKNHLIPKQFKRHNLKKSRVRMDDAVILDIIDKYTAEAGVRNLERQIATVCRKVVRQMLENPEKNIYRISTKNISDYLGAPKILPERISEKDEVGVVNGLAYTTIGGDMLKVEAVTMKGTGKVEVTGSLGDVMKESAKIAVSIVRSNAEKYGIDPDFYKNLDIHVHFPEGAVPKDGPSAGVTLVTVLTSILGNYPVRRDVAMTGEVSLTGRIIPIGGLREKSMAAHKAGIKTVLVPEDNRGDYERLDDFLKNSLEYVFCKKVDEVLERALVMPEKKDDFEILPEFFKSSKSSTSSVQNKVR